MPRSLWWRPQGPRSRPKASGYRSSASFKPTFRGASSVACATRCIDAQIRILGSGPKMVNSQGGQSKLLNSRTLEPRELQLLSSSDVQPGFRPLKTGADGVRRLKGDDALPRPAQ